MDGEKVFELTLHPRVPMPYVQALAPLAALSLCEQLGSETAVLWPSTVLAGAAETASVTARAGYDGGVFVQLEIVFAAPVPHAERERLKGALLARVHEWEQAVGAGRAAAGPFAPFAGDYFDRLACLGEAVELLAPDGRSCGMATLKGIDMWGRICVETADGREADYAPEQMSLRCTP